MKMMKQKNNKSEEAFRRKEMILNLKGKEDVILLVQIVAFVCFHCK
jgi:hypothetical protein